MKRPVRRALAATLIGVIALLLIVATVGIRVPLTSFAPRIEKIATEFIGRPVTIDGDISLSLSPQPAITLDGITVGNPAGWPQTTPFFSADHGTGQIDAMALVGGAIRIVDFHMEAARLNLIKNKNNDNNFTFSTPSQADETNTAPKDPATFTLTDIDNVHLTDVSLAYHDEFSGTSYDFTIAEATASAPAGADLTGSIRGVFNKVPVDAAFTGDELSKLSLPEEPWRLKDGAVTIADTRFSVTGSVAKDPGMFSGFMDIALKGADLPVLGNSFDVSLPDIGTFSLHSKVRVSPAAIQATDITFESDAMVLYSDLSLWLTGDRPLLMGSLLVEQFSIDRLRTKQDESPSSVSTEAVPDADIFNTEISLDMLRLLDADIRITAKPLHIGTVSSDDISALISLVDGALIVPVAATIMDVPMDTQVSIDGSDVIPAINVRGVVGRADVSSLLTAFAGEDRFTGETGGFSFAAESSGSTVPDLLRNLQADISIDSTIVSSEQLGELLFIDSLQVTHHRATPWVIEGTGRVRNKSFATTTSLGILNDGHGQPAQGLRMALDVCDSHVDLEFLKKQSTPSAALLSFAAQGGDLCGVLKPATRFLGDTSSFSVSGSGTLNNTHGTLIFDTLQVNALSGSASVALEQTDPEAVFMTVDVLIPRLNLNELTAATTPAPSLTSVEDTAAEEADADRVKALIETAMERLSQDLPELKLLTWADADLNLTIGEVFYNDGGISDIHLNMRVREGTIAPSPFSARMSGVDLSGSFALDLSSGTPKSVIQATASNAVLADIFKNFGLTDLPDVSAQSIDVEIDLEGSTLLDMIKNSSQKVSITNGVWKVGTKELQKPIIVSVSSGNLVNEANKPAKISLEGSLNEEPVTLDIRQNGIFAAGSEDPVEIDVRGFVGDVSMSFSGEIQRQQGSGKAILLDTHISGSRLDKMSRVLNYDFPPIGPYRLHGALHVENGVINLGPLTAEVGSSSLEGSVRITVETDEAGKIALPVPVTIDLQSPTLQLDDFHLTSWQRPAAASQTEKEVPTELPEEPEETSANLLGPEFASKVETHLEVAVNEVVSGTDHLGSGTLKFNNVGGKNTIESMRIEVPGGYVDMDGFYQPLHDGVATSFTLDMKQFDYGVLVRRFSPQSGVKGIMNVSVDLSATAPNTSQLSEHLSGNVRLGVVPEDMASGILDIWAVNILAAALPALSKGEPSKINCLVTDFALEDGLMTPRAFLLDTTKMRVQGTGEIDLKNQSINFKMRPTPKSPQFFSLATPINITGTIRDFHIGVSAGSVIGTVFRFVSSVITVPLQKILTNNMEPDGAAACKASMAWVLE
jgi:uncharacterized protein involved in outer membrane biogenesis